MTAHFFPDYAPLLSDLTDVLNVLPLDPTPSPEAWDGYDALIIGGGPTPAYYDALIGSAPRIRALVDAGVPYLGFSAGAMVAATTAILGGHRVTEGAVCPVEWGEGIEQLTARDGLSLVPWAVDVHAAQAGTVSRAAQVVAQKRAKEAVAIDEDTALVIDADGVRVVGSGRVWWCTEDEGDSVRLTTFGPGPLTSPESMSL